MISVSVHAEAAASMVGAAAAAAADLLLPASAFSAKVIERAKRRRSQELPKSRIFTHLKTFSDSPDVMQAEQPWQSCPLAAKIDTGSSFLGIRKDSAAADGGYSGHTSTQSLFSHNIDEMG